MPKNRKIGKALLVGIWLVATTSLSVWWLIYGLRQLEYLQNLAGLEHEKVVRKQMMLIGEGAFLVALLLVGAVALLYYINRERRRHRQVKDFFSAFSHDIKTSLASFRLQVESLQDNLKHNESEKPLLERLHKDTVRLELQLENSLFFANLDFVRLWEEEIDLQETISSLNYHWPKLSIQAPQGATIKGDRRAVYSILRNIFQNSSVHGNATEASVEVQALDSRQILVCVKDNGVSPNPFKYNFSQMDLPFSTKGGTGVGLYISQKLLEQMGGRFEKANTEGHSFLAQFRINGSLG